MGFMVYSLLWVMQDLYHKPYTPCLKSLALVRTAGDGPKSEGRCLESLGILELSSFNRVLGVWYTIVII